MKKIILILILILLILQPVSAEEFSAPEPPPEAQALLPNESASFTEDLLYIVKKAITLFMPSLSEASRTCVSVLAICMFISVIIGFNTISAHSVELVGTVSIAVALLIPANSLINIGIQTATRISEYGKLMIPVITAALAAEGGTVSSATLYTGTVLFNTVLTITITKVLIPFLYAYLALSIAKCVIKEPILNNLHKFIKWLMTWSLKLGIYAFTGYLGITGVISGNVDAAAIKAAKIAISGSVPVIGSVISDASETILASAGLVKNSVGTLGLLAIIALWIGPFIQIGTQYLVLKVTGAVSGVFGSNKSVSLIDDFSSAMGYLVAMIGTLCLLFFISTVCFMKGVK